jgi:hypothetical protein
VENIQVWDRTVIKCDVLGHFGEGFSAAPLQIAFALHFRGVGLSLAFTKSPMRDESIWDVLNRELFFVKDTVKASEPKLCDKFDVYDPVQRMVTMTVREPEISGMTRAARLTGGSHDRGAAFDLIATLPNTDQQTVRISARSPMFGLNSRAVEICDHRGHAVGALKKIIMTIGLKFRFMDAATRAETSFELKSPFLAGELNVLLDHKVVTSVKRRWDGIHSDFFQREGFDYAIWISPEVKKDSRLRQALIAFALAHHRVAM